MRKQRDAQIAALERQHRAEPVDAAWVAKAEPALAKLVTAEELVASGLKPDGYDADCRSSTCRVTATFTSAGDAQDWSGLFATGTGMTFRRAKAYVVPTADGKSEVRIYGVRR